MNLYVCTTSEQLSELYITYSVHNVFRVIEYWIRVNVDITPQEMRYKALYARYVALYEGWGNLI